MSIARITTITNVEAFLARNGQPVDRLTCGCEVPCTRRGTTDPHSEQCNGACES
jgi:hypothetical protein